jgi:uncharacterized protein (DUF433 family)
VIGTLGERTRAASGGCPHADACVTMRRFPWPRKLAQSRSVVDPGTQGGVPVISSTRVPYDAVASLMREDVPPEKISDYYPSVSVETARGALDFAMDVDSYGRAS